MTFATKFNTTADMLMEKLRSVADGKQMVDLLSEFQCTAVDAIAEVNFLFKF